MIPDVLEHRLAEHCAPTLLGAKAASLLSLSREEFPELPEEDPPLEEFRLVSSSVPLVTL